VNRNRIWLLLGGLGVILVCSCLAAIGGGLVTYYYYVFARQVEDGNNHLGKGLVAYYPFDGNANDESGNGNHGTVRGARLTTDRFGHQDSAYVFDGVDDYIALPDSLDLIDTAFSISAWVKPNDYGARSHTSQSCSRFIFSYRYRSHAGGHPTNSGLRFGLNEDSGCGGNTYLSTAFFGPDFRGHGISYKYGGTDWFLYTVIRDPEKMVIYVNGEVMSQRVIPGVTLFENSEHLHSTIGAQRVTMRGGTFLSI
jgi:hypothetical protein